MSIILSYTLVKINKILDVTLRVYSNIHKIIGHLFAVSAYIPLIIDMARCCNYITVLIQLKTTKKLRKNYYFA